MNPRHGEVWLADMGMAGKTRPAVVLIADNLSAPRSLIIHIPITRQNRGSELEIPLGHLPSFLVLTGLVLTDMSVLRTVAREVNLGMRPGETGSWSWVRWRHGAWPIRLSAILG